MRKGFDSTGQVLDSKRIRIGYIGCGSHSRRNVIPAIKYSRYEPIAVCDLDAEKAEVFAKEFGFEHSYSNHIEMLENEQLDAVFIVTGYDKFDRPFYPKLAKDCLLHNCHVFIEKPPATTCEELQELKKICEEKNLKFMVGFKKMFANANVKAKELSDDPDFGGISLALIQYPEDIPTVEEMRAFLNDFTPNKKVNSLLDHFCHPLSLMVMLMGHPTSMHYVRSPRGNGVVYFNFPNGAVCSMALTIGTAHNGGMELTQLYGNNSRRHIVVDNNIRLTYHRNPPGLSYGATPSYYQGSLNEATAMWEPEFSLGQIYNKGLFLLGYYGEVEHFADAVLNEKPVTLGNLDDAIIITKIFDEMVQGPGKLIDLTI